MEKTMKLFPRYFALALACVSLFACSPARTGVVDGALTTNLTPAATVRANAPFALADSGRVWVSQENSDDFINPAPMSFDYAVYTEPGVSPASRFAYAAIIWLEDPKAWTFEPQGGKLPGSFGGVKPFGPAGLNGTMYTLCVPGAQEEAKDWAGELLVANGTAIPEFWLAKRWVFDLYNDGRVMAEYREPWPDWLEKPGDEVTLVRQKEVEYLRDFEKRAVEVFSVEAAQGEFAVAPASGQWQKPAERPNITRLVGDVRRQYNDGGDNDWD